MKCKMLLKKGQSAIEFMILIGAVTFLFLSFLLAINQSISDANERNKDLLVKEIALTVQNEISIASKAIDGYQRNFSIPLVIVGNDYHINILSSLVFINTTDGKHSLALPVANVTGSVKKGSNIIKKLNSTVYLNQ